MQTDPFLSPCTKHNSKWIKDIHIKPDTLKLIENKLGKNLELRRTRENFLNRTTIAYDLRSRNDKWDFIKLQSFMAIYRRKLYKAKVTLNRTKQQPTNWEKIFTNLSSDKWQISDICKEHRKLETRETYNTIKNGILS